MEPNPTITCLKARKEKKQAEEQGGDGGEEHGGGGQRGISGKMPGPFPAGPSPCRIWWKKLGPIFRGAERLDFGFFLGRFLFLVVRDALGRRNALTGDGEERGRGEKQGKTFHRVNRE